MQQNDDEENKQIDNRDEGNTAQGFETKNRSDLGKIYNLIICKEGENDETPHYAVMYLSIMIILDGNPVPYKP